MLATSSPPSYRSKAERPGSLLSMLKMGVYYYPDLPQKLNSIVSWILTAAGFDIFNGKLRISFA
jgi:hypothetical protein